MNEKKFTKYSNPWRKKVAEIYDIPEEEMMMAKKEQVIDFERGVIAGMVKTKADLTKSPDTIVDILKCMSEEDRNKVLDEFCEPIESCHEESEMEGTLDHMKEALVNAKMEMKEDGEGTDSREV